MGQLKGLDDRVSLPMLWDSRVRARNRGLAELHGQIIQSMQVGNDTGHDVEQQRQFHIVCALVGHHRVDTFKEEFVKRCIAIGAQLVQVTTTVVLIWLVYADHVFVVLL